MMKARGGPTISRNSCRFPPVLDVRLGDGAFLVPVKYVLPISGKV